MAVPPRDKLWGDETPSHLTGHQPSAHPVAAVLTPQMDSQQSGMLPCPGEQVAMRADAGPGDLSPGGGPGSRGSYAAADTVTGHCPAWIQPQDTGVTLRGPQGGPAREAASGPCARGNHPQQGPHPVLTSTSSPQGPGKCCPGSLFTPTQALPAQTLVTLRSNGQERGAGHRTGIFPLVSYYVATQMAGAIKQLPAFTSSTGPYSSGC